MLIKDNIESAGPLPTTAGSLALAGNVNQPRCAVGRAAARRGRGDPRQDQPQRMGEYPLVTFDLGLERGRRTDAQSMVAGPQHMRQLAAAAAQRSPPASCGSRSGRKPTAQSPVPAAINGIVGLKPTVGLVSRTHIVPISHSQDTAGPMTDNVRDAAELLTVIAGSDPADPATAEADRHKTRLCRRISMPARSRASASG